MKEPATKDGNCVGCEVGLTERYSSSSVLLLAEKFASTEGVFVGDDVGESPKGLSSVSLTLKEVVIFVGEIDGTDEYSSRVTDGSARTNITVGAVVDTKPDTGSAFDIGFKAGILGFDFT